MSEQWNGEGMPPVGIECEYSLGYEKWTTIRIIAHVDQGQDVWLAVGQLGQNGPICMAKAEYFRSIRTPEQIAEDELREVLLKTHMPTGYVREVTAAVLKAGYRKVEGAKE